MFHKISEKKYLAYTRADNSCHQLGRHVWCLPALAITIRQPREFVVNCGLLSLPLDIFQFEMCQNSHRSTQRAVLQKSCSTVCILLGKLVQLYVCSWQDEIHLLEDFLAIFLLNGHYRREAGKFFQNFGLSLKIC